MGMYRKITNALHLMNIAFQAFYSLALPIGIGALAAYLLTKHTSVGAWVWPVLMMLGVFVGLYSMIKFILSATANFQRLEEQRDKLRAENAEKEQKRAELLAELKKQEGEVNDDRTE